MTEVHQEFLGRLVSGYLVSTPGGSMGSLNSALVSKNRPQPQSCFRLQDFHFQLELSLSPRITLILTEISLVTLGSLVLVAQSYQTLCEPTDYSLRSPLSVGFSRQEYWSGLPCPPPGDLPDPGLNLGLLHCRHILYSLSHQGSPRSFKIMLVSHFVLGEWTWVSETTTLGNEYMLCKCWGHPAYWALSAVPHLVLMTNLKGTLIFPISQEATGLFVKCSPQARYSWMQVWAFVSKPEHLVPHPEPGLWPGLLCLSILSPARAAKMYRLRPGLATVHPCWPHRRLFIARKLSVQFTPVVQSCPTLCDLMDCSMPGFPVHHQLLELAQIHVHGVSDVIQPPHPLLFPSPLAFNLSQHQGLFQ